MSKAESKTVLKPVDSRLDLDGALSSYKEKTGEEISVYKLAKELSIPRQSLKKWESGESLKTLNAVLEISRFTGHPLSKLITDK